MLPPPAPGAIVVVGAPRSGTSLVAQLVASAGVGFGDHLLPASSANPRGFLEDVRVTELNDALLAPHVVGTGAVPVPTPRLAWAGVPASGAVVTADPDQRSRMRELLAGVGRIGVKDPRFVWTLDAWRPALPPGTAFVAVVRHPAEVAASLQAMAAADPGYWGEVVMTTEHALRLWEAAHRRLLGLLGQGRWLVLDHADLLAGRGATALAGFTGGQVDGDAVDPGLHRSARAEAVPADLQGLYEQLRARARRDGETWSDAA